MARAAEAVNQPCPAHDFLVVIYRKSIKDLKREVAIHCRANLVWSSCKVVADGFEYDDSNVTVDFFSVIR